MKNILKKEYIDKIMSNSEIEVEKYGEKTTILKAVLPNGFVVIESSSCIDPKNFNMEIGKEICLEKLTRKIWELEGYQLQTVVNQAEKINKELGEKKNENN